MLLVEGVRENCSSAQGRPPAGLSHGAGRTTIAVSDYVTSALFQHLFLGSPCPMNKNAMDESEPERLQSGLALSATVGEAQSMDPGAGREEAVAK